MKRLLLLSAASALILVAGCDRQAASGPETDAAAPQPAPAAAPATAPDLPTAELTGLAFRAAWDRNPPVALAGTEGNNGGEGGFSITEGKLTALGGDRYALISSGSGVDAGHVTPGVLAIHYLTRTPDGFRRADGRPLLVYGGTFGNAPDWDIRHNLLPNPVVVAESGGVWQGYACSGAELVELTPQGPVRRSDFLRLNFSSGGALGDKGQEMEGRIEAGTPGRDFRIQYSGASQARVTYRLNTQGLYAPVDEPADLPWC